MPNQQTKLRRWGRLYLTAGGAGLLLLFGFSLIPAVQTFLSRIERDVFISLNDILEQNPVWDWTILVTASEFWVYLAYGLSFLLFIGIGWTRRREDYGQIFGYILFAALLTYLTEEMGDFLAQNMHRVLPWRDGVVAAIKRSYDADFFDIDKREGVVDDSASALVCLFLVMAPRMPRAAFASLALLILYSASSLIVGTQWLSVLVSSVFMGAVFAGAGLAFGQRPLEYAEKKSSQAFVSVLSRVVLSRRVVDPEGVDRQHPFWTRVLSVGKLRHTLSGRSFWERRVKRRAARLINADPDSVTLFTSPALTMDPVRSGSRVRFLKTAEGEVYVVRAFRSMGGFFGMSPSYVRFTNSVKNNVFLRRLGMPAPRVVWTQEMVSGLGLQSEFFAIEEHLECRTLNPDSALEIERTMQLLTRLHGHTSNRWGGVFDERPRTRLEYIVGAVRGDFLYFLKKTQIRLRTNFTNPEIERIWQQFESLAVDVFKNHSPVFRLIHGDVSPRNFCAGKDSNIHMLDFLTVRYDLASWEIIKACISLTRKSPQHCRHAWETYFAAAGEDRWREFLAEAELSFARFAIRELAHKRVGRKFATGGKGKWKASILEWIAGLTRQPRELWGERPAETRWLDIFEILGIHKEFVREQRAEEIEMKAAGNE